jgi:hypothetical protein
VRLPKPGQAASVRGQSNQVLSGVLRAGRASTAGLSPLSTPDSILMCYRKRPRRDRPAGGQREGFCSVHYKMQHEVFGVSVEFRARVS